MKTVGRSIGYFLKKADIVLLLLCIVTTIFGIVAISSATNYYGSDRYVTVQTAALVLGIAIYVLLTLVDVDIIAERRELLLVFCVLFIGSLKFFGVKGDPGNKSWLNLPFLPVNIQPAEICKIFFIIILAKTMSVSQNKLSTPLTVGKMGGLTMFLFVFIVYVSADTGVALIYLGVFLIMAFAGGVNLVWFLAGLAALGVAAPIIWPLLRSDQKDRILMLFDPSIDPEGLGVRWDTSRSLQAIENGGTAYRRQAGNFRGFNMRGGLWPLCMCYLAQIFCCRGFFCC